MKERRQHLRVELGVGAVCEIEDIGTLLTTVRDISLGGACIESEILPRYGTEFRLVVKLPGAIDFSHLPATVRWAAGKSFGVQFGLLGARETHLIANLIQQRVLEAGRLETVKPDALAPVDLLPGS